MFQNFKIRFKKDLIRVILNNKNNNTMEPDKPYVQEPKKQQKKLTYGSLAEFIKKTRQLLKEQQKFEIDLFNEMTQNRTIQQIQQEGYGLSNMLIVGEREGFYGKTILTLMKAYHSQKNPIFLPEQCKLQVGDDVAIMKNNSVMASGVVYKRAGPKIKITVREQEGENQEYDYEGMNCHLVLKWNQVTFKRYFRVLQQLEEHTVFKQSELVNKFFPDSYDLRAKRVKNNLAGQTLQIPNMNEEQIQAIKLGLKEQAHLIHGPPGTGKTTTVCQLIVQAVKKGQKVLACAPSNIAVDNMVESLGKRVNCVRIGNPARVIEKVFQRCLDYLITQHTSLWKNEVKKLQATRKRIQKQTNRQQKKKLYFQIKQFQSQIHLLQEQTIQQILNEADVICATNVGAADRIFRKYLSKRKFDLVVIDQCGQGLQVSCWIPLLKGKRAVLAGDHKQLPPTIKGMQNSLLSITLFSRAMDQLSNVTSTMLLVQYRMNKLIMGWSNKMFYEDRLVAHDSVKDHLLRQLYQNVEQNEEVVMMVDTSGCKMGQSGEQNQSKMNVGQADLALSIYRKVLSYGVQSKHIAILTPYSKQVSLLKTLILQQNLPQVDVSTVDGIQGRQKQCIIITLVRSNKKNQIGFLKDWRRMNVAVTRARRMLVLIGNADCVSKDHYIGTLVKWIQQHGKSVSALQFQGDPLVRFGQGVQDSQDFSQNNKASQANKDKNKKKKKKNNQTAKNLIIAKPSIYQAHTEDQILNLKGYYRKVFQQIKDQMIFPGATNFERKLIHEVAGQMNLCHQTSPDKKQIKVWIKQQQPVQQQVAQEDRMIQIRGKNKNKFIIEKQLIQNEKFLIQKQEEKKIKITGGKFGDDLQNLIGDSSSQQEEPKEEKIQSKQEQKVQQKKPTKKKNKKGKKGQKQEEQTKPLDQDWEKDFEQFQKQMPKTDECFKCKKKITSITSVKCRFCSICFCRNHVLAEEHGCDQAAMNQARSDRRQVDKLVEKGAQKIKQKIKQQQQARKRKPKQQKGKKK